MLPAVDSAKTIHALGGITLMCALEANCCHRSPAWEGIAYIKDQDGGGSQLVLTSSFHVEEKTRVLVTADI